MPSLAEYARWAQWFRWSSFSGSSGFAHAVRIALERSAISPGRGWAARKQVDKQPSGTGGQAASGTHAAEVARDYLRLGVFFRAVGIMLQVPGAARYAWVDDDNETWDLIKETDDNALINVLAECFDRLGGKQLIEQVPGGDYNEEELPEEWTDLLNKQAGVKNGLLNVVAECLDALVVRPGMVEINAAVEQPWWLRWPVHNT